MATNRNYGTGRRKSSVARVYIMPGTGKITVNKRSIDEYFGLETLKTIVRQPLVATQNEGKLDVLVNVCGGGRLWLHRTRASSMYWLMSAVAVPQDRPALFATVSLVHFARWTATSDRF